jgi:hypothetical protein
MGIPGWTRHRDPVASPSGWRARSGLRRPFRALPSPSSVICGALRQVMELRTIPQPQREVPSFARHVVVAIIGQLLATNGATVEGRPLQAEADDVNLSDSTHTRWDPSNLSASLPLAHCQGWR